MQAFNGAALLYVLAIGATILVYRLNAKGGE